MLKIFFKYFLSLTFIFISLINEVQAMDKRTRNYPGRFEQLRAQDQANKEEKERKVIEGKAQRREALIKKRKQDEGKRKNIRDVKESMDAGEYEDIENYIQRLEDAVKNKNHLSKFHIKRLMKDAKSLVDQDNPEDNAKGVIFSEAIAYYLGVEQGDIDSAVECIGYADKHDPDVNLCYKILLKIKSVRDGEIELAGQQRDIELESAKNAGKKEGTRRGIIIAVGGAAAVIGAWYGLSYVFGEDFNYSNLLGIK